MVCLICKNSFISQKIIERPTTTSSPSLKPESADTALVKDIIYCHEHTSSTGHFCCALFMSAKGKKEGVIEEEREKRVNSASCALKGIQEQDCLAIPLFSSTLHTSTERKS